MQQPDYTLKSTYYYNLPEEFIAQTPIEPRDHSRMLVFDKTAKKTEHKHFFDILNYLKKGDVLVINNTKVIPCRLYGIKEETGANVEIFITKRLNLTDWEALVRPAKRLKAGSIIKFSDELKAEILLDANFEGGKIVRFIFNGIFEDILNRVGNMPLPPYIKQKLDDGTRYQTIYSKIDGSTAAPTAGLHFTSELLEKIKQKGVTVCEILLHVGLGTFRPVKTDSILQHNMHTEYYEVSQEVADTINSAKKQGRRIIAVGTTSVRTLESSTLNNQVVAQKNTTNLFIYPPYKFKIVDAIITNFHLPESTLIMLVSAFAGYEETMSLYKTAIAEKYRFFSFGDAMFIY